MRVAVIGGGVIGLATAWALERLGFVCLVFEQGAPGGGQSAGESRIFRHAHDDPRQFALAVKAREGWRDWEEQFGARLISRDGAMAIGEAAVAKLAKYAGRDGMEVRGLSPHEIRTSLPIFADYEGEALIDELAGAIRTRLTIANLISAAGVNLIPEPVESVTPRANGGVEVQTSFGPQVFDAAVVAAGVGTVDLAADAGVEIPSKVRACVRLTMPLVGGGTEPRLACVQDSSGYFGESTAYGSPVRGNREYTVGLALAAEGDGHGGEPEQLAELTSRTADYMERAMPGLDAGGTVSFQRWIAELPWAADGLAIWQTGDAYFIAGNNLFKLAPALATALAQAVVTGRVEKGLRPEDRLGAPVHGTSGPLP